MQKLILNSTQIPNVLLDEIMPQLSGVEFKIIMTIARQTYGWHKEADRISISQLKLKTGTSNGSIGNALKNLKSMGLIKVTNKTGREITTKEEAQKVQELYYQINATYPKIGYHLSKNWIGTSPEIGDTKETTTKTYTNVYERVVKKQPVCPVLKDSILKSKYPQGHNECVEFIQSCENYRKARFINRPKQFMFLHKILLAGYDFDQINKQIPKIDTRYGQGQWDVATLVAWLEKGGKASGYHQD